MKRVLVIALLITFSLGTVAKAQAFSVPKIKVVLQHGLHQGEGSLPDDERQREEERRRLEEERRRKEEELRRQDEERRKQEERRRFEEERRRQDDERRRQDEERRKQEERRRFEEEKRRQDDERRRQDDERRRQEDERRRQDEERRRQEEERRGPGHGPAHRERGWDERDDRWQQNGDRVRAREVLHETADCLARAQRLARFGRYREGLGKAYAHQEEARNLFFEGRYQRAIAHSMRARQIANFIIEENRPGHRHVSGRPDHYQQDDDLDNQLSIKVVDDHVALKLKINLD